MAFAQVTPGVSSLGCSFIASALRCSRTFIIPGSYDYRYSQATMLVVGITGFCDGDNVVLGSTPWVPASTSALQFFQRLWTIYDSAVYTYTGDGSSGAPSNNSYGGTFDLNNSIVGAGRIPTVNNYLTAFTRAPNGAGGTDYEPDATSGATSPVFDYFRFGPSPLPNPIAMVDWNGGVTGTYTSGALATFNLYEQVGGGYTTIYLACTYTLVLSSATDINGLYNRIDSDYAAVAAFPASWNTMVISPYCLGYHMAPDAHAGYSPVTYDGSSYTQMVGGVTPPQIPSGLTAANCLAGWEMAYVGRDDGGQINMFRAQSRTTDGRAHYYWIGNLKWNNSGLCGATNPAGTWKLRISLVREGWMLPDPATGEARIETDFPAEKGWPIPVVSGCPVTTEYNFIVIDQTPAQWLAAHSSTFPGGFGDYTY